MMNVVQYGHFHCVEIKQQKSQTYWLEVNIYVALILAFLDLFYHVPQFDSHLSTIAP